MKQPISPYVIERRARRAMATILVALIVLTASCWLCALGVLIYGR